MARSCGCDRVLCRFCPAEDHDSSADWLLNTNAVYKGGQAGEPVLIFPTSRTRGGDNRMVAARFIDIPARRDSPPYFRLTRSRPEQTGEMLSLIFTSSPLFELADGRISNEQLTEWIHKWGSPTEMISSPRGLARPMTVAENEAGARDLRLEPNDPPPQTIYRIDAKSGNSICLQLFLRIE
jgi:hypothetical protein